ncbi:MAG: nucleoside-diphosphate kinase [Candidatus Diapherotrites archaeon]|uniref:Nucleoside diphosphate kinase n=1 Tax=Candidatus Iainarchaeum sp. TaxID=3101447 RepID=A0A2D6M0L1_9ARCH|nr:nucleoside-diphosphate kinase [Candidatus Diapherotrites archaeon]|tara:strand:- start:3457 stop:3930 length:474 start_codon:yes stop_codon:yes gene_type:complete
MERTLVIIKPDAINRCLVGEILRRFEKKGLKIAAMKMVTLQPYVLKEHYAEHKDKVFFKGLINYMTSIPSIPIILEGKDIVNVVRTMIGSTQGREAEPGTIRGDYSVSNQNNLVHAAESKEKAEEEIKRFFKEDEIYTYQKMNFDWIYSKDEKYLKK